MKLFCFLIGIFTYGFTCAQQPPALPPDHQVRRYPVFQSYVPNMRHPPLVCQQERQPQGITLWLDRS